MIAVLATSQLRILDIAVYKTDNSGIIIFYLHMRATEDQVDDDKETMAN